MLAAASKTAAPAVRRNAAPVPAPPARARGTGAAVAGVPAGPPALRLTPAAPAPAQGPVPGPVKSLVAATGAGSPILPSIKEALESSLEVPLHPVRVHTDPRSSAVVDGLGARAFTYGLHIFLGSRERPDDLALMAHEVAHVVQQQGRPLLQMYREPSHSDSFEREADRSAAAVQRGEGVVVRERTGGARVQGVWPVDELGDWLESKAWDLLREYAPELVPVIKIGPVAWLKEKVTSAFESMFNSLTAPVRAIAGAGRWLSGHFAPLLAWLQDAAAKIARNDCSPLREAAEKIEQLALKLITPVVEKLQAIAEKVKSWFTGLWDKFGAPAWDWIKKFAGWHWEQIKNLASLIWDKTEPVRKKLSRAWTWLKNKLGIGEGPEGQNGILQWVQEKLSVAWDWVKARLEPFKKELMIVAGVVGGIALLVSPAGPVVVIGGIVVGIVEGIRWVKTNWGKGDGMVRARAYLEKTLIPSLLGKLNKATAAVTRMATSINGALGGFTAGMGRLVNAAVASLLRFAVSAVQWIADQVTELARWGSEKLAALSTWVTTTFAKLQKRLQPLLDFLGKVGEAAADIMKLPLLVVGELWKLIPQCLRDSFVDFLVNQILKRVPIVKDVIELLPAIWTKLKATGLMLIRKVFKDGDLMGAAFEIFKLVLNALQIPMELVTGIIRKAATARDMILKDPLGFLGNMLRAMKQGFIQFGDKIWKHLKDSIVNWLRGVIESAGLKPPADLSLPSVLEFVLQVLGISVDKILARLEKKLDKETYQKVRKALSTVAKVWDWISTALNEGPQGVWNRLKGEIGDLWGILLDGAIGWVTGKVTKIALPRITAALGTAPVGAVVEAIIFLYKAIQTAAQYAKRILELVSSVLDGVLDIARGAIDGAAKIVEASLGRALTVVIGFLANYLGFGDLGKKLKEIVESIQEKVTAAIDVVIDKAIAAGKAVISAITKAAKGVAAWWKKAAPFKTKQGKEHKVFVDGKEGGEEVFIESDRIALDELLPTFPAKDKGAVTAAKAAITKAINEGKYNKTEAEVNASSAKIQKQLDALAALLPNHSGFAELPAPTYKFDTDGKRATQASVINLSSQRPWGSVPASSESPPGWDYAIAVGLTQKIPPGLRRLHLINERFGGPGRSMNLAVAAKKDNEDHLYQVENKIKEIVGDEPRMRPTIDPKKADIEGVVKEYIVRPIYFQPTGKPLHKGKITADISDYAEDFECSWKYVKLKDISSGLAPTPVGPFKLNFASKGWKKELEDESDP